MAHLRESYLLHAALTSAPRLPHEPGVERLWRDAVRSRRQESMTIILTALQAASRRADFGRVAARVADPDRRVRGAAVEILDGLLPDDLRDLILPLVEEGSAGAGHDAARRRLQVSVPTDAVATLLASPDPWVQATTAYALAHLEPARCERQLTLLSASPDRFVAFAAGYALARVPGHTEPA